MQALLKTLLGIREDLSIYDVRFGLTFAGIKALVPRVIKLGVTSTAAVPEPRTTTTTTTDFSRFVQDTAFGAYQTDCRRRACSCVYVYVGIAQNAA